MINSKAKNMNHHSLNDCISEYFKSEIVSDYEYEKTKTSILKLSDPSNYPGILFFQLKRFTFNEDGWFTKNDSCVEFNLELCFFKKQYNLHSFIIHKGSLESGHYHIYIRKDDHWVHCDDKKVYKTENILNVINRYYGDAINDNPNQNNCNFIETDHNNGHRSSKGNAYILIYMKQGSHDSHALQTEVVEHKNTKLLNKKRAKSKIMCQKHIYNENGRESMVIKKTFLIDPRSRGDQIINTLFPMSIIKNHNLHEFNASTHHLCFLDQDKTPIYISEFSKYDVNDLINNQSLKFAVFPRKNDEADKINIFVKLKNEAGILPQNLTSPFHLIADSSDQILQVIKNFLKDKHLIEKYSHTPKLILQREEENKVPIFINNSKLKLLDKPQSLRDKNISVIVFLKEK